MTTWHTSIDELMALMRSALVALIPVLNDARIPWRTGESYDDFDRVAEALFESIVTGSLQAAIPRSETSYPNYGLIPDAVSGMRVIMTIASSLSADQRWVFQSFESVAAPFDSVRVLAVDDRGLIRRDEARSVPFEGARFEVMTVAPGLVEEPITQLWVEL